MIDAPASAESHDLTRRQWLAYALAGSSLAIGWFVWIGNVAIDSSEGVYLFTSRLLLHGGALYSSPVAAHPPGVFLTGLGVLSVADSISAVRAVLACLAVLDGALVVVLVHRLTGCRWSAIAVGLLSLVMPWGLRDRAWVPETFCMPLLLGTALFASRPEGGRATGFVGGLTVAFKLTYLAPAIAVVLVTRQRRRAVGWLLGTVVVLVSAALVAFGADLPRNVLVAQTQVGTEAFSDVRGLGFLGFKEVAPLVALAALGWRRSRRTQPALADALAALTATTFLSTVTIFKVGTGLGVLAVVEPPALVLAAAALAPAARPRGAPTVAVAVAVGIWMAAQSVTVVVSPTSPWLSYGGNRWEQTRSRLQEERTRAERCPSGVPFSGEAYVAFLTGRVMPGDEPDTFIVTAPVHRQRLRAVMSDWPRCP